MEDELKQNGHKVTLADASDQPPTPKGFDGVFIGVHSYAQIPVRNGALYN
jgi:hypothetical protein